MAKDETKTSVASLFTLIRLLVQNNVCTKVSPASSSLCATLVGVSIGQCGRWFSGRYTAPPSTDIIVTETLGVVVRSSPNVMYRYAYFAAQSRPE